MGNLKTAASQAASLRVMWPAVGLIVVSVISIAVLFGALMFSQWLVFSGKAAEMRQPVGMSKVMQVQIRSAWNVLIQVCNIVTIWGAINMARLRRFPLARIACILSLIPCVGPCFLLGMPFGIWGLAVLNDPQVAAAFDVGEVLDGKSDS